MLRSIICASALVLSGLLHSQTITAVGDPWPPFLDPEQPKQGLVVEIATAAFASQGYQLDFKFVPWARAIAGVKNASFDLLLGTWYTEERTAYLMYSQPYLSNSIKFLQKKGNGFDYAGLTSLSNMSIGVVRDYGYGDDFLAADNFKKPSAKDFITNVRKLTSGRVDLTLEDEIVAKAIIAKEAPELLQQIEFAPTPYSSNNLHVTSGLANAKHEELIAAFNKGLATIKASGEFDRILNSLGTEAN